jgi:hypothetical protein
MRSRFSDPATLHKRLELPNELDLEFEKQMNNPITKTYVLPVALAIASSCINTCAGIAKPVVQAVQDIETSSPSDSQGFVWMSVCIGLLVLIAGTLIIATITYSYRKKEPDSEK